MSREDLIRFAKRDWAAVAWSKERHWLRVKQARPSVDLCRLTDDMLRHAKSISARLSSREDRLADWNVHHRVGQALRAVTRPAR